MSFYSNNVLPRLQDRVMKRQSMREVRSRVCTELSGKVVEIGFGTGLNVGYYPPEVRMIFAIEPSRVCMQLAELRISASETPIELAGLTGEHLGLPSEEFAAVLSTWTLCSIPDLVSALQEIKRVLKPQGTFHFVEHGTAPEEKVVRWQKRLEPLHKKIAGGCHLTRNIPEMIEKAGLRIDYLDTYYIKGAPKPFGYTFEGRASKP